MNLRYVANNDLATEFTEALSDQSETRMNSVVITRDQ